MILGLLKLWMSSKAMPAQQVFSLDDHGQGSYLWTNQTKQICGLITYMKHVFNAYMSEGVRTDPFRPFSPEEWNDQTSTMMKTFLVQHLPTPIGPQPVTSGPIPSSKSTAYSPAALELMSLKKGIKREITAYPSLKDERYFDGFNRSLFIVAKTHECNDVLDPNYTPGSEPEEQELFEAKQTFMFSVFNTNLQTDMGKTIVRKHLASTDAQAVWKELSEHMKTSSKGASEKRRLTQYVTNTVLDDNFKLNGRSTRDERTCDRNTREPILNRAQAHLAPKLPVFESRRVRGHSRKRASLTTTHNDQTTYQTIHFKHNNTNTWAKTVLGINSNRISPTARTTGRTAPSCQILHGWYTSQPTRQSCISGKRGID